MLNKLSNLLLYLAFTVVAGAIVFAIVVPAVGVSVQGEALLDQAGTQIARPTSTFAPPKFAVPPAVVITRLDQVGEFAVVKMETKAVVVVSQDNPGLEFAGVRWWKPENTTVTMAVVGTARAGYDATAVSVDVFDNTLTLNLPPPVLLGWEMDVDQSQFVEFDVPYRLGIAEIGAVRPETATYANAQARAEGVAEACEAGILEQANTFAIEKFRMLFADLGYDVITVNTQPPGTCR